MDDTLIQSLIAKLSQEDDALEEVIRQLGLKRTRVQQAKTALTTLLAPLDEPVEFEGKLADAIRMVLRKAKRPLAPVEIRDELKTINYDLGKHANPLASIHSVLRRMAESDTKTIKQHNLKDGAKYAWIEPAVKEAPVRYIPPPGMNLSTYSLDDIAGRYDEFLRSITTGISGEAMEAMSAQLHAAADQTTMSTAALDAITSTAGLDSITSITESVARQVQSLTGVDSAINAIGKIKL